MARLAAELEEEHIVRLKRHLNGPTLSSWNEDVLEADQLADKEPRPGETDEHYAQRKAIHAGVLATLDRELIAAGLLAQEQEQPGSGGPPSLGKRAYDEVITVVSPTGRLFLEYLRDPEELFAM